MPSMPRRDPTTTVPRPRTTSPLSRERIVAAAIDLADRDGADGLSMRRLAQVLGVDPMSLYHHVRDKDDLLDAVADGVVGEVKPVIVAGDWKASLRGTILSSRQTLRSHPWAPSVIGPRSEPTRAMLAYMDTVLGILHEGGFSVELAHHAVHVLGSRVLGFSQDLFVDSSDPAPDPETSANLARQLGAVYPHVGWLAMAVSHEDGLGPCDDDVEFLFALDLILDGLERRYAASPT
jgi:AcrR family transcriptional regulator